MKKVIAVILIVALIAGAAYTFKDLLYEAYLQSEVDTSLTVESGVVHYCGYPAHSSEIPSELVSRVKSKLSGPQVYRQLYDAENTILADTAEIQELSETLDKVVYFLSDKDLAESASLFSNIDSLKARGEQYTKAIELRSKSEHTVDELAERRKNLRHALFLEKKETLRGHYQGILEPFSCIKDDPTIVDAADRMIMYATGGESEAELQLIRETQGTVQNKTIDLAREPLISFTEKFAAFIDDVYLENKVINGEYESFGLPGSSRGVSHVLTVSIAGAFAKKELAELGCHAYPNRVPPALGSAIVYSCFMRKDEESSSILSFDLSEANVFAEEYSEPGEWGKVEKIILQEIREG